MACVDIDSGTVCGTVPFHRSSAAGLHHMAQQLGLVAAWLVDSERRYRASQRLDNRRQVARTRMNRWVHRLFNADGAAEWTRENGRRYRASLRRDQRRERAREAMYAAIRTFDWRLDDVIERERSKAAIKATKVARKQMQQVQRAIIGKRERDTLDLLYRRRQIDGRQQHAGLAYRQWWNECGGSMPCTLDQSRARGGTPGSSSPTMTQLLAAERLRQASVRLGRRDERVVYLVVVEGHTIEDVAAMHFGNGGKAKATDVRHTGQRLRLALEDLADVWLPTRRGNGEIRGSDARDEQTVQPGVVEPARVAHASSRRLHTS